MPEETPVSTWGEIIVVSYAAQAEAPILLTNSNRVWVSSFNTHSQTTQHQLGILYDTSMTLPLPVNAPHTQTLLPLTGSNIYLIWKEMGFDGGVLKSATIASNFSIRHGPIDLARSPVYYYTAVNNPNDTIYVVFNTGLLSEPEIRLQEVDALGRPYIESTHLAYGQWPTLHYQEGALWLYWTPLPGRRVYRGLLNDRTPLNAKTLKNVEQISAAPKLNTGDYIVDFMVSNDSTHLYFVWNIMRAAIIPETWISAVPIDRSDPGIPYKLTISSEDQTDIPVQWATVANKSEAFSIAAQAGRQLSILHFEAGALSSVERVVALPEPGLLRKPTYTIDSKAIRYLAWSQPTTEQLAALKLVVSP